MRYNEISMNCVNANLVVESEAWLHVRIADETIELIVLLSCDVLWIEQPQRLHFVYLLFV